MERRCCLQRKRDYGIGLISSKRRINDAALAGLSHFIRRRNRFPCAKARLFSHAAKRAFGRVV
jgi:hypothetical protein